MLARNLRPSAVTNLPVSLASEMSAATMWQPCLRQSLCESLTDPGGGAGDDGDLVLVTSGHAFLHEFLQGELGISVIARWQRERSSARRGTMHALT